MSFKLEQTDIPVVLDWYEYAVIDSYHRGGETIRLPDEQVLLQKLKRTGVEPPVLDDSLTELVFDWMNKAVQRKYGSTRYLTSAERALFSRLSSSINTIVAERKRQPGAALDLLNREFQYERARKNLVLAKRFDELAVELPGGAFNRRIATVVVDQWQWLIVLASIAALVAWIGGHH